MEAIEESINSNKDITNPYMQNVYISNDKEMITSPIFSWEITSDGEVVIKEDGSITYCANEEDIIETIGNIIKNSPKFWSAVNKLTKRDPLSSP